MEETLIKPSRKLKIVPQIAFSLLDEAKSSYDRESCRFTVESLQSLHAVFGNVLLHAAVLLDTGRFVQYTTRGTARSVLKIGSRNESRALFPYVNFCHCLAFRREVLIGRTALTCKHVLAARLAQICGKFKVEVVMEAQLVDLLNCQLEGVQAQNDTLDAKDYTS